MESAEQTIERLRAELAETTERCKFLCEANDALLEKSQLEKSALVDELRAKLAEAKRKYEELILSVESKFPGESRHETALRYIRRTESVAAIASALAQSQPKAEST